MILIIGGGLTGLSAAYFLQKQGIHDVLICEKELVPGGLLRTQRMHGFTFDYTGHFLHINSQTFKDFLDEVCDLTTFDSINRKSAIYHHNRITPYPFQMHLHGLPSSAIIECIEGFTKRPRTSKTPKSFYEWVIQHFGKGMGKHFFFPFQEKILSYDIRRIEPSWTGRFVPRTSLHDVIAGALTPITSSVGYNAQLIYPMAGGIDHLITALRKKITAPIQTNKTLVALDTQKKIATFHDGTTQRYTDLISTIPLDILLSSLQKSTNETLSDQAPNLLCNSVLNLNIGLSGETLSELHWLYVPEKHLPFYRLGFWHNINKNMAPPHSSFLYAEYSFLKTTSIQSQQKKRHATQRAILKMFSKSHSDILFEHDLLLPHAYVLYTQWRKKNLSKILNQLKNNAIHSIGRFGAWKYSSMQEAVLDGQKVADTLAPHYTIHKTSYHPLTPLSSHE